MQYSDNLNSFDPFVIFHANGLLTGTEISLSVFPEFSMTIVYIIFCGIYIYIDRNDYRE